MLLYDKKICTNNKPMNYVNVTTDNKSITADEVEYKLNETLQKELERKTREPSKRLDKNSEKRSARREKILAQKVETTYEMTDESVFIGVKPPRIPLDRMKRKPGHRAGRPEVTEFDEEVDLEEEDVFKELPPPSPKMLTIVDTAIKQLCNKQDIIVALTISHKEGVTPEDGDLPIDVIAVMDGHGPDLVTDIVRELDFAHHFTKLNTPSSMQSIILASCNEKKDESDKLAYSPSKMSYNEYISKKIRRNTLNDSGTTYSAAYVHRNEKTGVLKVIAEWLGDSPIFVLVNNELVFESIAHHASNSKEVELMKQKGFITDVSTSKGGFEMISDLEIVSKPGKYATLKNGDGSQLACTRSLGHNGITCIEAETATIIAKMTDEVKIIVCSDGVGDMLHLGYDIEKLKKYYAEDLVDLAESRWKQTWKVHGTEAITRFPSNGYDDCSAAVWWQKKA